jgi:hypothetical protein
VATLAIARITNEPERRRFLRIIRRAFYFRRGNQQNPQSPMPVPFADYVALTFRLKAEATKAESRDLRK